MTKGVTNVFGVMDVTRFHFFSTLPWMFLLCLVSIQIGTLESIELQRFDKPNPNAETITFNFTTPVPIVTECKVKSFPDGSPGIKVCEDLNVTTQGVPNNSYTTEVANEPSILPTAAGVLNDSKKMGEVQDMNNSSYKGGQDVDELGKGNRAEKPDSRESAKVEAEIRAKTQDSTQLGLNDTDGGQGMKSMGITAVAAVAAGICILLVISGYAGILIWKRVYSNRYGNREELINEDDLGDFNESDLYHFEGATIQIET